MMFDFKKIFTGIFAFTLTFTVHSQIIYPQNYFHSPLNIPLKLAGNFGEIRGNHFHSGIDIKTDSVEGKPVFAVADGYVVRVKISSVGFGNALYINHPNGCTTVYGHLQRYNDSLTAFAQRAQNSLQSFEIDTIPDSLHFVVKQGDLIGYSGNSGSSGGPHLHFETRNTKSEKIINPLLFGFDIRDTIAPVISNIAIYADKILQKVDTVIAINPSTYSLSDTLKVTRNSRFGFGAFDLGDDGLNKLGIYDAKFFINDSLIWQYRFTTFSFDESRYVNAHIDYAEEVTNDRTIERCYKLPNNHFSLFDVDSPLYKPNFVARKIYECRLVLTDYAGNASDLLFYFKVAKPVVPIKREKEWIYLGYARPYKLKTEDCFLQISANSLYDNIFLKYHVTKKVKPLLSKTYHINDNTVPLHTSAVLSIKVPKVKKELLDKLCIASIDEMGFIDYEGGTYKNGFVSTAIRHLGNFAIDIDTIAPYIIDMQIGITTFKQSDTLKIQLHDNKSGVSKYKVYANDKLVIATYDAKRFLLLIPCKYFMEGENTFTVFAEDKKKNSYEWKKAIAIVE